MVVPVEESKMNILFLSQLYIESIQNHSIYTDLLNCFIKNNHHVYIVTPAEKRRELKTELMHFENHTILRVRTGNLQKTNVMEKGISTLTFEQTMLRAIKKYYSNVSFEMILYATPPITTTKIIKYIKKRDNAKTYLLLKDIFPQNAVDLEMFSKRSLIYTFFRKKEKELYRVSDYIGCMSPANVNYVLDHNPEIARSQVEVCPNSIEVRRLAKPDETELVKIRSRYGIPIDKTIFVYGGNLGKPQGIDFLCQCLSECRDYKEAHFLIVGSGTEFGKSEAYIKENNLDNVTLLSYLPKEEYDMLVSTCDVGLICLDHRFTIPNFPSRLLSYMQASMPVLTMTDRNTDVGQIVTEGGFGYWCESVNPKDFKALVVQMCEEDDLKQMGEDAYDYLEQHYSVEKSYQIIMNHFGEGQDNGEYNL